MLEEGYIFIAFPKYFIIFLWMEWVLTHCTFGIMNICLLNKITIFLKKFQLMSFVFYNYFLSSY